MKKKRIAWGLALFLVLMWLCTLISKSIYASRLPMVTTCRTDSKYIEHVVEAEGIVEAGAKLPVTVLGGLRVTEVFVQTGDRVEEGDLLFTVDLEDMKKIMADQELACQKTQLQIDAILHNRELAQEKKALDEARAREDYDALARYQDTLVGRAAEDVVQAEKALEELPDESRGNGSEEEELLKRQLQAAAYAEADAKWNRDNTMKDAGRRVEDTVSEEDEDATLAVYRAELAGTQEKLAAYQEILDGEGKITAPLSGMITDVYVQTGGRVPDTASFLVADSDAPCQFRVTLTKEDKTYVNLNDDVKLKLGDRREINASIDYLAENENAPGTFTALLRLPEDTGTPGQSGTITCAKAGEKRPCCIPLLALHENPGGSSYVYVVSEREGILGMEYYVAEINVSVADKNDKLAAVEGALSEESRIIQSADKEIQKGDVVRLAEP
ncbi:MAG: biotin/lipoyl-binding protein [Lachnospiraceae bacterium]|nr:biotin/lipoyl-binding protein [Lachnospiraceae bacterium]